MSRGPAKVVVVEGESKRRRGDPWPAAQWLEHVPVDLRVQCLIPGQEHVFGLQV